MTGRNARLDDPLEHVAEYISIAEALVAGARERRMIRDSVLNRCNKIRHGAGRILRNQGGGQGQQGAVGRRQDLFHEEVHGRILRDQDSQFRRQEAGGRGQDLVHEEV